VLPLIPPADRDEQLGRWYGIGRHPFGRDRFQGFWPPELGFCMELIPTLKRFGYRYVLVDSQHVDAVTPMRWEQLRYRPHLAQFGGDEIIVVVRDRELSDAQEAGMDAGWFIREVSERPSSATSHHWSPPAPTATTAAGSATPRRTATSGPSSTTSSWNASSTAETAASVPRSSTTTSTGTISAAS